MNKQAPLAGENAPPMVCTKTDTFLYNVNDPIWNPKPLRTECRECGAREPSLHKETCRHAGKIFYISYNHCNRCGVTNPELFMVPDNIWRKYVQNKSDLLCIKCFDFIVKTTKEKEEECTT